MRSHRILLSTTLAAFLGIPAIAGAQDRAVWMREARWGIMNHYLADWKAREYKLTMNVDQWNKMIDAFDAEALAKQLESIGAGYYLISIGQNSGYYLSPNAAYDRFVGIQPSKCSRRDLVADIGTALQKRGIKLMVYLPSGAPASDKIAREALGWRDGPYRLREFQIKWEQVIREWSERWGNKVAGWWWDGCFYPNSMYRFPEPPNFASFAAAARAGNPNSALGFNGGAVYRVFSMTPFDDYTGGEQTAPERMSIRRSVDGKVDGKQLHVLSYLGKAWGMGDPRFTTDQVLGFCQTVWKEGGAITWDVPVQLGGTMAQPFIEQLTAVSKAAKPPAAPVAQDRAAWMAKAGWGVMNHYLSDWKAREYKLTMNVDQWNKMIDNFDVETLAKQLESAGAGYYLITIGQNSGYYLSPNATYDKFVGIQPSKCSRRDLVADLYAALQKRGIKLMVYLPSGAPGGDKVARNALRWENGPDYPNREFQIMWQQVIREWGERWGDKVAGWWFDGCYFPNAMYRSPAPPNFDSFAAAARAGNPNRAVAFNPGVMYRILSMTPQEDYTAGEIDLPERMSIRRSLDGKMDGVQIQMLSYLGKTWGMGDPRFTSDQAVGYSRVVWKNGGAVTWDVPVQLNGTIAQPFLDQLTAVGKAHGAK